MDATSVSPALLVVTVVGLALAPFVAVMVTAFTKLVVVLSLLRNALGLQQVPPNLVVNGLALIVTMYVMYPVGLQMGERAQRALPRGEAPVTLTQLVAVADGAKEPLKDFLIRHTSDAERAFFQRTAQRLLPEGRREQITDRDLLVIVPAFTVSELTAAFQIGFLIYLPFLIIDLIVANVLLGMGMMMLSPTTVSLPFKLLLFVTLDGWSKLVHGLVLTYR
jgi:type III secretion protein R